MRQVREVVVAGALALAAAVSPAAFADERADWGVVVSIGDADGAAMLLENQRGFKFVVVDAFAPIRGVGQAPMTLSDIRPGDHVDYAVSTWAGTDIADFLQVTPRRQAAARP